MKPLAITELCGAFSGHLAIFPVPTNQAARALPRGLALLPQPLTREGTHPILVWFGRQQGVHLTHLRALPGFPLDYLEVIAGVPYVGREGGGSGPFLHLCQLFLDSAMAVFGGVTIWGFPKKMARMQESGRWFEARSSILGARVLSCEAEPHGEHGPLMSLGGAGRIAALLALPLLEGVIGNLGPPVVASTFTWDLDQATASPARAKIALGQGFVPALVGDYDVSPLDETGMGAFHITSRWRLSLPYPAMRAPG